MSLLLKSVLDPEFHSYGQVLLGYRFTSLLEKLTAETPCPQEGTVYVASEPVLEEDTLAAELSNRAYGGMPIQLGYCNGDNHRLNALEYHRDSEIDIAANDAVLLLARQEEIVGGMLDTARVRAFLLPRCVGVELYATTLHYAPCTAAGQDGFRVVIVLPKGTNTEKPQFTPNNQEDMLLTARNKWLLAHPDSAEAANGAYIGLAGENILWED